MANIRPFLVFAVQLLFPLLLGAQSGTAAQLKEHLNSANSLYKAGWYKQASAEYLSILPEIGNNANALNALGMSEYFLGNFNQASRFIRLSMAAESKRTPDKLLNLARSFHYRQMYESALVEYSEYIKLNEKEKLPFNKVAIEKYMQECEAGVTLEVNKELFGFTRLDSAINTKWPDYGAHIIANGDVMLFSSQRKGLDSITPGEELIPQESVFISRKRAKGWSDVEKLPAPFNTGLNNAWAGSSKDGRNLFLFLDTNGGDLWQTAFFEGSFSIPLPVKGAINTPFTENSITFNRTHTRCFFVSNRTDIENFGGMDIYTAVIDSLGLWGNVQNLGSKVNTKYDEESVFFDEKNSYLYFSSCGHSTIGGFDIFKIKTEDNIVIEPVINIGTPVNTVFDDMYFTISDSMAFYTTFIPQKAEEIFSSNIKIKKEIPVPVINIEKPLPPCNEFFYSIGFIFDSSLITDKTGILDTVAVWLKNNPTVMLAVRGHTDYRGEEAYNIILSERRARSAKKYIVSKGIEAGRISVTGVGSGEPRARTDMKTWDDKKMARDINRRIELVLSNQVPGKCVSLKMSPIDKKYLY